MCGNPFEHFMSIASHGHLRGCSSGEESARMLLEAVWKWYFRLDGAARAGLLEALKRADEEPGWLRDWLAARGGAEF